MEIGRGGGKITPSESAFLPRGSAKGASPLYSRSATSVQNSKFKIRDSGFRNRESKFKIYDK